MTVAGKSLRLFSLQATSFNSFTYFYKAMKQIILFLLLILSTASFAQSSSFQALKYKFADEDDVHSFNLSGFFCRAALRIAASDEDDKVKALLKAIDHVRFIVVPKQAFAAQQVSVNGFRQYLSKDGFEQLMTIRNDGETIHLY